MMVMTNSDNQAQYGSSNTESTLHSHMHNICILSETNNRKGAQKNLNWMLWEIYGMIIYEEYFESKDAKSRKYL
jgi:hypothetical protein